MNYRRVTIIFLVLSLCCSVPAMGGVTTYLGGSPRMSAALSGTNEFTPGQDAFISVIVQNSGLNPEKFLWEGTIDRDDNPTTAKMVMVGLSSGTSPVIVKTDPQNMGDIKSQGTVIVKIAAKIPSTASVGEYQLPLIIRYTYLSSSQQETSEQVQFQYREMNETFPLTIRIKPQVTIDVIEAVPENLGVGTEGYLNLKIKNIGYEDGKKATVKITRNGNSPIIPADSSVFVGDFPRDGTVSCRYKVAVSSEAQKQTYPVDVAVTYENREGEVVTSASDTVGIPVGGKNSFVVTSGTAEAIPGSDQVIMVEYQNTGDTTAYHAQARLSAVDPFKSSDNSAYLGDLKPGEKAAARYKISTGSEAAVREYSLDTEIRYRDALDNSQISDSFKVPVRVVAKPAADGVVQILAVIVILAVIGISAGYYVLVMRKKK